MSPKCEARESSKIHRFGVFAKQSIKKGELIAIWGGYILTAKEVDSTPKKFLDLGYPVQVYKGFFLGPKNEKDIDEAEMFNHSCDSNAGVKGQNILAARRNIKADEEVCFDYETTDSEGLKFICQCGLKKCRKKITGKSWKDPKFQKANKGYFSWYLEEKIKKLKSKKQRQ